MTTGEMRTRQTAVLRMILASLVVVCGYALTLRADEPFARSRDYDLQHSKIALRFELGQKKVIGDVTHTISLLRNNLENVQFDSVGLEIQSVKLNKSDAKFRTTDMPPSSPLGSRPASHSSSSNTRGLVASARASSTRFCSI